ncbi:WecB/TagA/CpsF family glycosyltransferase [Pseudoalteromonas xiamenensis]|uniref:WecB/TagA/CpsF family glycosyltransferase n=1 Tax=Pseudoalteromonas xiamenensis TaxID=882626 RepID=UPI0035EEB1FD
MLVILDKLKSSLDIIEQFEATINKPVGHTQAISFVNPYSYLKLRDELNILRGLDGLYTDAISSALTFSMLLGKHIPRTSFDLSSFALYFLERANEEKLKVFLLGAKKEELEKTVAIFKANYPEIEIVGYRDGYFDDDEAVIKQISDSGAEYVLCGMGTPRQDRFAIKLKQTQTGQVKQIYTCGGFLHQTSERLHYYPKWVDKLHLRWLYRAFDDSYVWERLFVHYPKFFFLILGDRLKDQKDIEVNV